MQSATPTVYEPSRHSSREEMPARSQQPEQHGHVNVAQAKEEFAHLRRELTRQSQKGARSDLEKQVSAFCLDYVPTPPTNGLCRTTTTSSTSLTISGLHHKLNVMLVSVTRLVHSICIVASVSYVTTRPRALPSLISRSLALVV